MKIFLDANICLDLLDTTRSASDASVAWYMAHKDDPEVTFNFSGDFITTLYYILSERKKIDTHRVVHAIDVLSTEVLPLYLHHSDFVAAKQDFYEGACEDFEDLIILHSALRAGCDLFVTHDTRLLQLGLLGTLEIKAIQ